MCMCWKKFEMFLKERILFFFLVSNETTKFFHVIASSKCNRARILIQPIMTESGIPGYESSTMMI